MNITELVRLHLASYQIHNGFDALDTFTHLARQISEGQDLQDRRNFDGHVTSSFMLLDPTRTKVLLIHHKGFDMWLCPGGHYEGMVSPRESALRELEEETGFPAHLVAFLDHMDFIALDIDTHAIPARPEKNEDAHWHHDFLYLGVATEMPALTHQAEEVYALKWLELDEMLLLPDERVRRVAVKAIQAVVNYDRSNIL